LGIPFSDLSNSGSSGLPYFISYSSIAFDLLIVLALLWRKTRLLAVIASCVFHLFNSSVFQIGIFPYLSLAAILFFILKKPIEKTTYQ
jgi:ABC-type siderophore export system fused ATPase/permease subunit